MPPKIMPMQCNRSLTISNKMGRYKKNINRYFKLATLGKRWVAERNFSDFYGFMQEHGHNFLIDSIISHTSKHP